MRYKVPLWNLSVSYVPQVTGIQAQPDNPSYKDITRKLDSFTFAPAI